MSGFEFNCHKRREGGNPKKLIASRKIWRLLDNIWGSQTLYGATFKIQMGVFDCWWGS